METPTLPEMASPPPSYHSVPGYHEIVLEENAIGNIPDPELEPLPACARAPTLTLADVPFEMHYMATGKPRRNNGAKTGPFGTCQLYGKMGYLDEYYNTNSTPGRHLADQQQSRRRRDEYHEDFPFSVDNFDYNLLMDDLDYGSDSIGWHSTVIWIGQCYRPKTDVNFDDYEDSEEYGEENDDHSDYIARPGGDEHFPGSHRLHSVGYNRYADDDEDDDNGDWDIDITSVDFFARCNSERDIMCALSSVRRTLKRQQGRHIDNMQEEAEEELMVLFVVADSDTSGPPIMDSSDQTEWMVREFAESSCPSSNDGSENDDGDDNDDDDNEDVDGDSGSNTAPILSANNAFSQPVTRRPAWLYHCNDGQLCVCFDCTGDNSGQPTEREPSPFCENDLPQMSNSQGSVVHNWLGSIPSPSETGGANPENSEHVGHLENENGAQPLGQQRFEASESNGNIIEGAAFKKNNSLLWAGLIRRQGRQDARPEVILHTTPPAFYKEVGQIADRIENTIQDAMQAATREGRPMPHNWEELVQSLLFRNMVDLEILATFPGAARLMLTKPPVIDFGQASLRSHIRRARNCDTTKVSIFQEHLETIIEASPYLETIEATLDKMSIDSDHPGQPGASSSLDNRHLIDKRVKMVVICPQFAEAVFLYLALCRRRPQIHTVFLHGEMKVWRKTALLAMFNGQLYNMTSAVVLVGTFQDVGTEVNLSYPNYRILTGPLRLRSEQDQVFGQRFRGQPLQMHRQLLLTEDNPADRILMATQAKRRIVGNPFTMSEELRLANEGDMEDPDKMEVD